VPRPRDRVAVLETHSRVLAEQRVENVELALVLIQVLQRYPGFAGLAVDDGSEALHERAAAGVLACQPDGTALQEQ
jgi:hypothetical protein